MDHRKERMNEIVSGVAQCLFPSMKLLYTGLVTTWMGDCPLTGKPSWYVPNHLGQFSLLYWHSAEGEGE